ncbi:DUF5063 domain-containing protein [Deinococcus sp. QL22]|uniref:DUF5063 domain-containing protein n=1 Tax=Deinococcus sp. QL22 TaxID=2939437 RepID=UPI0020178C58|nr:DUF5063 domain-containing protein [Deinococcus sp. QL22]UQN10566.1 DUF5063 domain-containing protein [Deinococcus sp. QL22]
MTATAAEQRTLAVVQRVHQLITQRASATPLDLQHALHDVREQVSQHPNRMGWPSGFNPVSEYAVLRHSLQRLWPELGWYDAKTGAPFQQEVPGEIGDALDDLTDIAQDLGRGLQLAESEPSGALDYLRFMLEVHWGPHSYNLERHLYRLTQGL